MLARGGNPCWKKKWSLYKIESFEVKKPVKNMNQFVGAKTFLRFVLSNEYKKQRMKHWEGEKMASQIIKRERRPSTPSRRQKIVHAPPG